MKNLLPKRIKKGDTIGLITPSGVITNIQLEETVEKIKQLGYNVYYRPSVLYENGYLAGTDKERAEEFMHMFKNDNVDAILCVRGGYGATRILNLLCYETIKLNPKVFIGYSDVTAFITAIYKETGLVAFHGPVGTSDFNVFSIKSLLDITTKINKSYTYTFEREPDIENNSEFEFYTINAGKAGGDLIGGNLSVLVSMIGTKFEPDFEGKIVFLEEIDERTYRIDRMLTQLIQATNIKKAAGIAFGIFKGCDNDKKPTFRLKELLIQLIKPLNIPAAYGFPFGHVKNNMCLPVGVSASLDTDKKILSLNETTVQ